MGGRGGAVKNPGQDAIGTDRMGYVIPNGLGMSGMQLPLANRPMKKTTSAEESRYDPWTQKLANGTQKEMEDAHFFFTNIKSEEGVKEALKYAGSALRQIFRGPGDAKRRVKAAELLTHLKDRKSASLAKKISKNKGENPEVRKAAERLLELIS